MVSLTGTVGIEYSLVSREIIADSVEPLQAVKALMLLWQLVDVTKYACLYYGRGTF